MGAGARPGRRPFLIGLLKPKKRPPVTCGECGSSDNTPAAFVCADCGGPLYEDGGWSNVRSWLFAAGFVLLAALAGIMGYQSKVAGSRTAPLVWGAGIYVIAAVLFTRIGAGMLRHYKPARTFFIATSVVVFAAGYALRCVNHQWPTWPAEVCRLLRTPGVLAGAAGGLGVLIVSVAAIFLAPGKPSRRRGTAGLFVLFAAAVALSCAVGYRAFGSSYPFHVRWLLGESGLVFLCTVGVISVPDGFRIETGELRVMVLARRPFASPPPPPPRKPVPPYVWPVLRPVYLAHHTVVWLVRVSVHHVQKGLIDEANGVVYWVMRISDLLLRLTVRAGRRARAVSEPAGQTALEVLCSAGIAGFALVAGILLPLMGLMLGAWAALQLTDVLMTYVTQDEWASLGGLDSLWRAGWYALGLLLLAVVPLIPVVRRHRPWPIARDVFLGLCYQLPGMCWRLCVTSAALSVFCWKADLEPFRFGPLSLVLTMALFLTCVRVLPRAKRRRDMGWG